ncbi:class I SAM-dependent methyltransferase [Nocardia sp. NEAU-G5]|uniref:Class I SAM-dependent methyltransferase n=1 Tax=Nocardia albiluteola TaxID=2842303 RepID=A0ABS6B6D6_9NOCA|nr:class I SAM-dependent methyltransferase [Nocardia albiluteola]MBU3065883.1 class I SAM-dependent methyltransferase [Nocardia albiluteola]
MSLTTTTADTWVRRWDHQQETYVPDRETVFAVIADAVAAHTQRPDPVVIDLACGPGSLGARILERLPRARVIGVDTDPVLLALGRSAHGLELLDRNLTDPQWLAALPISDPVDAIVSTTALHWLRTDQLAQLYTQTARLLRPGGILLNGDDIATRDTEIDLLDQVIRARHAERESVGDHEDWDEWWTAIKAEPELVDAVAERERRAWEHPENGNTTYELHLTLLRQAGFRTVSQLWQYGRRRIIAAIN